jgi:1-acyl-sn-glycerol-3-phosphate acyltransferase
MSDQEPRQRCIALTTKGARCKNLAREQSQYCHLHEAAAAAGAEVDAAEADVAEAAGVEADAAAADESIPVEEELTERERRQQLMDELDKLIARVRDLSPDYAPPAFSPERLIALLSQSLDKLPPALRLGILERLRGSINEDLLDAETWKGMWYMVNYTLEYQGDMLKRRITGDYETDEWGLDWEFLEAVRPFLDFMYNVYWRVETTGIENIPDYDRALLVSNHSGQIPWDGAVIMTAVLNEHPAQRLVRNLYGGWLPTLPFLSSILVKMGQAVASVENGTRLLEQDELVGVFPEGYKGSGKLFRNRYKLARFGRGDFVDMALNSGSPIIPVSVVGAEETYVTLAQLPTLPRFTGIPYFPVSMRFPWLGLLGTIPLPTKWYIDFGEPIATSDWESEIAADPARKSRLGDGVRDTVQEMVNARLAQRRAVFY